MKLIRNYLSIHLKIALEYRSSFILTAFSQSIIMFVELFTVVSLFNKFKLLNTYNVYELLLGFSCLWLGYSFSEMFGRGFDDFYKLIVNGDFDILLIRPRGIFVQIFGSNICYEKCGRVLFALVLYIYSAIKVINVFSITKILLLLLMIIGCITVIVSVLIIGASFAFITIQGLEFINIFTNGTRQVAQYPMSIYKKPVLIFFSTIVPISLVNYYPLEYLSGRSDNLLYVIMPLFTFLFLFLSTKIFMIGLNKYKSTGS